MRRGAGSLRGRGVGRGTGERGAVRVGHPPNRANQQYFQIIFQYLSVDSWHTLGSASVAECAKLDVLVGTVLALGGDVA